MKDIRQIIADNLVSLRKKHNLTQNELAKKLDYSDNTISRWECGEISPNIETLQKIIKIYKIPLASLFEENITHTMDKETKAEKAYKLTITLLFMSLVWFAATVVFVYGNMVFNTNLWTLFIWAIPLSFLIMIPFNDVWGNTLYKCLLTSGLLWSTLVSIYLQFLQYNMWLIFLIGVPAQAGNILWILMKRSKRKSLEQTKKTI
jgi:transcriptional regulator with XRE-family HTH domain